MSEEEVEAMVTATHDSAVKLILVAIEETRKFGQCSVEEMLSAALAIYAEECGLTPDKFEEFLQSVAHTYRETFEPHRNEEMN